MTDKGREKGKASNDDEDDDDGAPAREQESLWSINLRKGLFAVGKKGGPFTPSPTWKLEEDVGEKPESVVGAGAGQSVSARKLAANLWEAQDLLDVAEMNRRSRRPRRGGDLGRDLDDSLPFCSADRPESASSLTRRVVASVVQRYKSNERKNLAQQPASPAAYSSSTEVTHFKPPISPECPLDLKGRAGDTGYSLKTSTELLKVLNRIWSLEEQNASNVSVANALKVELEHAGARIQELLRERKEHQREINDLMNRITEDNVLRKNKEHDRMKAVVRSVREELEDERSLRRRSESLHRKLGKELFETKTALSMTLKNLEKERQANGLLVDFCDEFARGIVQYEKEVRELKKKLTKDCERKIDGLLLHISEVWLDERLQMQTTESCSEKANKGIIISRLEEDIVSFLQARQASSIKDDIEQNHCNNMRRQSLESFHLNGTVSGPHGVEDDESVASDLHCFELNMDKSKEGAHDHSKSQCEVGTRSIESARQSCSGRKATGFIKSTKGKNLSMSFEGLDGQPESTELGNLVYSKTDTYSEIADAEKGDASIIINKPSNSNSAGICEGNMNAINGSNLSVHYTGNSKVHHDSYLGEISHSKLSGREHCLSNNGDNNITGNFFSASGPVQQWNHKEVSTAEITECSLKLPQGLKESTLKAKLLEARIEGRHARLKALNGT